MLAIRYLRDFVSEERAPVLIKHYGGYRLSRRPLPLIYSRPLGCCSWHAIQVQSSGNAWQVSWWYSYWKQYSRSETPLDWHDQRMAWQGTIWMKAVHILNMVCNNWLPVFDNNYAVTKSSLRFHLPNCQDYPKVPGTHTVSLYCL